MLGEEIERWRLQSRGSSGRLQGDQDVCVWWWWWGGGEGWTKPVRNTGAWAQRWQVGMWGLEVRMKTRRLVDVYLGQKQLLLASPPLGTKCQVCQRNLPLQTKTCEGLLRKLRNCVSQGY